MALENSDYVWHIVLPVIGRRFSETKMFPKRKNASFMWDLVFKENKGTGNFTLRSRKALPGIISVSYYFILQCEHKNRRNPFVKIFANDFEFCNDNNSPSSILHQHQIVENFGQYIDELKNVYGLQLRINISACYKSKETSLTKSAMTKAVQNDCSMLANKNDYTFQLLNTVLIDPEFCDVTIQIGSDEIKAHRSILAAASPFFRAALSNDTLEKKSGHIKISDFTTKTMQSVVNFIYKGDVDLSNWEDLQNLLKASDFFNITKLKKICEKYIIDHMDQNNVLKVFLLAATINDNNLMNVAVDYFARNPKDYKESDFDVLVRRSDLLQLMLAFRKCAQRMVKAKH